MNKQEELIRVLSYYKLWNGNNKIVCPFHEDINPSLMIDLDEGRWFCFGCQKSGTAVDFVRYMEAKYNNLNDLKSYKKYLEILKTEDISNINIGKNFKRKKPNRQLYLEAQDYYYGLSKVNWGNDCYEIKEVKDSLRYIRKRGFTTETLNKAYAKITYNKSYQIIFPMLDNGEFKGWVCRTTDKVIETQRKYLYNEGFSKATTLVGDYGSEDWVIVVEGYMDRLKMIQNGCSNVVAILGWKMSKQQEQKLKDAGVTKIISALDNDECGKKGTKYLREIFGQVTRWAYLKGIKDPGEMTEDKFKKMFIKTMKKFEEDRKKWE